MYQISFWREDQIDIDSIKQYLESGNSPNIQDIYGTPPIVAAASLLPSQGLPLVKKLLNNGADPNIQDSAGNTALMKSFESYTKSPELVVTLLKAGADPNIQNQLGRTALMLMTGGTVNGFAYDKRKGIANQLRKSGIEPNITDIYGDTTLMYLQDDYEKPFVKMLLEIGADPYLKNKDEKCAIDCVKFGRNGKEIYNMLINSEKYKEKPRTSMIIISQMTDRAKKLQGIFK